jgi:hypothetical protein
MDAKEFNKRCAEYMDIDISLNYDDEIEYSENSGVFELVNRSIVREYNPHLDANDRNKVIEKMRIKTSPQPFEWMCVCKRVDTVVMNESMEAAQIACIEKALNS